MKISKKHLTIVVVVILVACIAGYMIYRHGSRVAVKVVYTIPDNQVNPLILAIEQQKTLQEFERLVVARKAKEMQSGNPFWHELCQTACWGLTNHIGVLIRHGGDYQEAIRGLESYNRLQAAELVRFVGTTFSNKVSGGSKVF